MWPMHMYTIHSRDTAGHVRDPSYSGSKFSRTLLHSLELCNTPGLRYDYGIPLSAGT